MSGMRPGLRPLSCVAAVLCAALLAACGGTAAPAATKTTQTPSSQASASQAEPAPASTSASTPAPAPKTLQKVTLRLPWLIGPYAAPFVLAKARGYYKQAGFDVSIEEGKGSTIAAETVASGSDTFGLADASAIALLISKGGTAKIVAGFTQTSPIGFVYRPSVTLNSPQDLIGHPIITSPGDISRQVLKAVVGKAGVPESKLTFHMVDPSAYFTAWKSLPNSVMLGFDTVDLQNAMKLVPDVKFTPYASFGVNTISYSLFTSTNLIAQHPAEVRAFTAASVKGWQDAIKDPQAAIAATLKAFPHADKFVMDKGMPYVLKLIHTPATQGKPIGWMASSDWKETLSILHQYLGMKTVKPLNDYYTNSFLPAQ